MLVFLGRRILQSLLVLLGATFIVFMLLSYSVDPLEDLRFSTDPNRDAMIAHRIQLLRLDVPPIVRYFMWLGRIFTGDLGSSWRTGQSVADMLASAIPTTITLVAGATILAIGLGILVGIVAALRQYTRFDYGVTFLSFVLFSLPSFWVAVLAKLWGAIGFNDFLANPTISIPVILLITVLAALLWQAIIGGERRTRLLVALVSGLATLAVLVLVTFTDWLANPVLGLVGVIVFGAAIAFAVTILSTGLQNRKALYSALTTVAVLAAAYLPLQWLFVSPNMGWGFVVLLALAAVLVAVGIGWLFGGWDRSASMRAAGITALATTAVIFIDRLLQIWPLYNQLSAINFRPISTIGSATPGLATAVGNDFWFVTLDQMTHLILPTITLILVSFAGYTRYTRASMLEVMNQDYIRTARAKGLPERMVTMRHAFRNALIPLATIIPLDIAALFGGAIITERIFGWTGMGSLFIQSLQTMDSDPIMGYFLVIGSMLVIASVIVDLIYAALDPRIRVS